MINGHDLIDFLRMKRSSVSAIGRQCVYDEIIAHVLEMINASEVADAIFDVEERHENCTVQILRNSITGEESVGWWRKDDV